MKHSQHKILAALLAVITAMAVLTACGGSGGKKSNNEAVNRVYPEGEGKLFGGSETAEITAETTKPTATQKQNTAKTTKPQATTAPKTTKPKTTQPTTAQPTTVTANVPDDNITGANINPNIGAIQGRVAAQIEALVVKSISLNKKSLTLTVGDSENLKLSYNPSNAAIKSVSLTMSNKNATAKISGSTVTVKGANAGTCTLTVTSYNGHKATCDITVKRAEQEITDDTVLSHDKLCTAANAARWADAVAASLEEQGMTRDSNLRGSSVTLRTDADKSDMSFNTAQQSFVSQAVTEVSSITGDSWENYKFNCITESLGDGEYAIVISVTEITE